MWKILTNKIVEWVSNLVNWMSRIEVVKKYLGHIYDWIDSEYKDYGLEREISSNIYYKLDNIYSLEYKRESDNIYELVDLFNNTEEANNKIDEILRFYDKRFPVGENTYLSWWNHMHIFFPWEHLDLMVTLLDTESMINSMYYKLLNTPLYAKAFYNPLDSNKLYMINRKNNMFWRTSRLSNSSKSYFITYKDNKYDYYSTNYSDDDNYWPVEDIKSIEFRLNNVLDKRIKWYYIWILLCTILWIKLKALSNVRTSIFNWTDCKFSYDPERPVTINVTLEEIVKQDEYSNNYCLEEEDIAKFKYNNRKLVNVLSAFFPQLWKDLKSYLVENNLYK